MATDPNLFTRAAAEDLCVLFADPVVDVTGKTRYASTAADAAVSDMVQTVMGLPQDDPRAADATAILSNHNKAALAAGNTPTNALKSTFTLACMAPGSTALGL